jgi:hypothetical protein
MTPHTNDQLAMSSPPKGGFRLLWPHADPERPGHATLVYVIEHSGGGSYEYTLISEELVRSVGLRRFHSDITERSQRISPPDGWARAAWDAYVQGGTEAVQKVLRQINQRADQHAEKNRFVAEVEV